ncbi:5301_t:CDS:2 [Diversispora eburnea]|uniref:5301_t:CDS:1 n=1 Tax=Diversispora eburnea TaxID=1213867 RepID=A0A9N8V0T9_9GLOM|nr:5301_t:CDS:2 [Diversispora eburnea]
MLGNLAVKASARTFIKIRTKKIYHFKFRTRVSNIRQFNSTTIRSFANTPNDLPNSNSSPLKPVKDNNNKFPSNSSTAKDAQPSSPSQEEIENEQISEENQQSSDTEHVAEYILRSPRRKRAASRSRTRATKPTNPYKPVIPQMFLRENYLSYKENTNSFASLTYPLEDGIRDEILYSARANLLPIPKSDGAPPRRGHLLLNCPIEGASHYLDSVVKSVATSLRADLLTFDRQDLMELTASMFSRKGFDSSSTISRNSGYENKNLVDNFQYNSSQANGSIRTEMKVVLEKIDRFFEALVSTSPHITPSGSTPPKIIYFRDVGDLVPTTFGTALINGLVDAVQNQRYLGDQIMIIAGYSPSLFAMEKKSPPNNSVPSHELQWVSVEIFPNPAMLAAFTHIAIPPPSSPKLTQLLQTMISEDKNISIRHINVRTLKAVCASKGAYFKINNIRELGKLLMSLEGLDNEVWGFERIHRLVINAIGISIENQEISSLNGPIYLDVEHFIQAAQTLKINQKLRKDFVESATTSNEPGSKGPEKLVSIVGLGDGKVSLPNRKNLKKEDLDKYEKKLLGCVVDPENIHIGFTDIHVAQSTVQTLQTLITLPLMRPQSFSYGVLRKHFISGVLLFGPPGTGKTMLAKAVAKESGSTVIEIKSSDVYDMYVGEDELDAIFGSRRSDIHNGAHREIINQFMAEWDGLTSKNEGVLIMGATNRPFDLDDAILRRMPRRILVDLPNEKDREQILHLHLRDEKLEPVINLSEVAKITKLYSGSDLKNLCISAALAAVREDAEKETTNDGGKSTIVKGIVKNNVDKPPLVRVLKKHHFELALKQVTPSCSEDMTSLTELRKWDGLYGDGAWTRKKRVKGIGFDGDTGDTPVLTF